MSGHQFVKRVNVTTNVGAIAGPAVVRGENETGMGSSLGLPCPVNNREVADVVGEQAALFTAAQNKQRLVVLCSRSDLTSLDDVKAALTQTFCDLR